MKPSLLIFTDLDGSLLDHYTYSHQAAEETLRQLDSLQIPVVANTSKTFAELLEIRSRLGNTSAFIAENGAAIYLPKAEFPEQPEGASDYGDYWVKDFCPPRKHWQQLIKEVRDVFDGEFSTFTQGGIPSIMEWTGLSEDQAKLAEQRQYGEPVRWLGSQSRAEDFSSRLNELGAHVLVGGRFLHVSGPSDKGRAMNWLADYYRSLYGSKIPTLAIGDGGNDIAMLDAADYALIIKSPVNPAPKLLDQEQRVNSQTLLYSEACGPEGWAEGVNKFLSELSIN